PVRTGLHAVADLGEADDETVWREAAARGVEVTPLSSYYAGDGPRVNGLVMGFSAVAPEALDLGMQQLAAAIEAAARPRTGRQAEGSPGVRLPVHERRSTCSQICHGRRPGVTPTTVAASTGGEHRGPAGLGPGVPGLGQHDGPKSALKRCNRSWIGRKTPCNLDPSNSQSLSLLLP